MTITTGQAVRMFSELRVVSCSQMPGGPRWMFPGGLTLKLCDDGAWDLGVIA